MRVLSPSEIGVSRRHRFARAVPVAGWAVTGAAVGVLAKLGDLAGSWWGDAGTYPAVWVIPIAILARTSRGPGQAALRAAVFFVPMTVAYYAWAQVILGFGYTRDLVVWLVLAAAVVPPFAAVVRWGREGCDALAAGTAALLAALSFSGGALHRVWLAATGSLPSDATRPVQAALEVVVAVGVVLWLPRTRRARTWAALALVPVTLSVLQAIWALSIPV